MEQNKSKKIAIIALIFAVLALSQGQAITNFSFNLIAGTGINITQSGDNYTISSTGNGTGNFTDDRTWQTSKINKSGDIVDDGFVIRTSDFSSGLILNGTSGIYHKDGSNNTYFIQDGGTQIIRMEYDDTMPVSRDFTFRNNSFDLGNANLTGCLNCQTDLNSKVNKSGDNMTGDLNINNAYLNLTTNTTFNFDFATVPRLWRNSSSSYRVAPLATLNMLLSVAGGIGNGGGASIIFWNKGNTSSGSNELNTGRFAYVWKNVTANTTEAQFYVRNGINDYSALSPAFKAYVNNSNYTASGTDSVLNGTIETGNIKVLNLSGTGKRPLCALPNGEIGLC